MAEIWAALNPRSMRARNAAGSTRVAAEETNRATPAPAMCQRKGLRNGRSARNGFRERDFARPCACQATLLANSSPDWDMVQDIWGGARYRPELPLQEPGSMPRALPAGARSPISRGLKRRAKGQAHEKRHSSRLSLRGGRAERRHLLSYAHNLGRRGPKAHPRY